MCRQLHNNCITDCQLKKVYTLELMTMVDIDIVRFELLYIVQHPQMSLLINRHYKTFEETIYFNVFNRADVLVLRNLDVVE